MLRRYQSLLGKLYIALDVFAATVALVVAWAIRFKAPFLPEVGHLTFAAYISVLPVALGAFVVASAVLGLYGTTRSSRLRVIALQELKSVIAMSLVVMSFLFFDKQVLYSRPVLFMFVVLTWVFSICARALTRMLLRAARRRGFNRKYILLIGMTTATRRFLEHLNYHEELGYHVIGFLSSDSHPSVRSAAVADTYSDVAVAAQEPIRESRESRRDRGAEIAISIPCLGPVEQLDEVLGTHIVDHLVFTLPNDASDLILPLVGVAESHGVHALLVPNFLDILPSRPRFDEFAGLPIVDTRYTPLDDAVNVALKRLFDIVFATLVLAIGSPVYLLIALLIRLTSAGPIFYVQERLGKNRRVFNMYKFRTMYPSEAAHRQRWTIPDDPRRTPIGRFLRSSGLDELPQFFNVLRGDMSVIGPRPEQPYFVEQFRAEIPRYMIKHRVRPGITGWAQVNGLRGDTSIEERIEYDLRYIEHWSFGWDLRIVLLTLVKGLHNRNAY